MDRRAPRLNTNPHDNAPPYDWTTSPHAASAADGSDTEYNPTPLHSPGGPRYDDLPPSYDTALTDARNGVTALDPNQIEAHRLTSNEAPNEPEVWEYRQRSQDTQDAADEPEFAPAYENRVNDRARSVPVHHVANRAGIPIGRVGECPQWPRSDAPSDTNKDPLADLLQRALEFTCRSQVPSLSFTPRSERCIAIPQDEDDSGSACEPVDLLRAYAEPLRAHAIRPADFMEFLDGFNAVCNGTEASTAELLRIVSDGEGTSSHLVLDYIRGANEAFFMPRGLKASLQPLKYILRSVGVELNPMPDGFKTVLDTAHWNQNKAQALGELELIEHLDYEVPWMSKQASAVHEMSDRVKNDRAHACGPSFEQQDHSMGIPPNYGSFGAPPPHPRPFGTGSGPSNHMGPPFMRVPTFPAHPPRPGPSNGWSAWGRDMGTAGQDFGKAMSDWGQQFGKQAASWGNEMNRNVNPSFAGPSNASRDQPPQYGHFQAYPQDTKNPLEPDWNSVAPQQTARHHPDSDSDFSDSDSDSPSSESDSDSDFDSDSPDGHAYKMHRRGISNNFKERRRVINTEWRTKKNELRSTHGSKGKGKSKAAKSPEWNTAKAEWKSKRKQVKRDKSEAMRNLRVVWRARRGVAGKKGKSKKKGKGASTSIGPIRVGPGSRGVVRANRHGYVIHGDGNVNVQRAPNEGVFTSGGRFASQGGFANSGGFAHAKQTFNSDQLSNAMARASLVPEEADDGMLERVWLVVECFGEKR